MANPRRRYYRTLFLGVAAMAVLLWSAVDQFGLSWTDMGELFLAVLLGVAGVVAMAALIATLWVGLRALAKRIGR